MSIARPRVTLKSGDEPELAHAAAMLPRLCGVGVTDAIGIAAGLPERQRAHLAVFCYGRVHMRELAIAIAKTLPLSVLLSAAPSDACGRAIWEATRASDEPAKPAAPFRRPVTLATAVSSPNLFQAVDDEPEDNQPAADEDLAGVDHVSREPELA